MRKAWTTADVGADGTLCMKLYVKAEPDAQIPEYLVCATPPSEGDELVGPRAPQPCERAAAHARTARIERASRRTALPGLRPELIGTPARLRFAGESVWRGERCSALLGCRDIAPDPPDARDFRLRPN